MSSSVVSAILNASTDARVRAAMLMGSRLESGWNPAAVGDNGSSVGPFQIHLPAHPGVSVGEAENAEWATHYMLPAYQAGVAMVPSSLWATNPAQAAATAAYHAERPQVMYPSSRYNEAWPFVSAALKGENVGAASGFTPLGGAAVAGADAAAGGDQSTLQAAQLTSSTSIFSTQTWEQNISDTLNYMFMGVVVVGGIITMTIGMILLMRGIAQPVATGMGVTVKPRVKATVKQPRERSSDREPKPYRIANPSSRSSRTPTASTAKAVRGTAIGRATTTTARKPPAQRTVRRATATRVSQRAGLPQRTVKVVDSQ